MFFISNLSYGRNPYFLHIVTLHTGMECVRPSVRKSLPLDVHMYTCILVGPKRCTPVIYNCSPHKRHRLQFDVRYYWEKRKYFVNFKNIMFFASAITVIILFAAPHASEPTLRKRGDCEKLHTYQYLQILQILIIYRSPISKIDILSTSISVRC